jgi:hypothetical protein
MKKFALLTGIVCLAAMACQKNNTPQPGAASGKSISAAPLAASSDSLRRKSPGTDVYITGIYQPGSVQSSAIYWKNGTIVNLTPNSSGSEAFGIAVKGNDVYVTGDALINGERHAVYWKNGVMHPLYSGPATSFDSEAYDITLDGNDVYIVGDYNDLVTNRQAMLWKNGVPHNLGYTRYGSGARAVKVKGSDVYVAGYSAIDDTIFYIATYWKNGLPHRLENNKAFSFVNGMAFNGNDIYIAGETYPLPGYTTTPQTVVYWKNGIRHNVQYSATAAAITISNNNVYIAGSTTFDNNQEYQATYWKNGTPTLLGGIGGGNFGMDIQVAGNDVYLLTTIPFGAEYFKNGVGVPIPDVNPSRMLVVHH